MSLSKREAKSNRETHFDPEVLAKVLRDGCPELQFALLLGSARDGVIPPGGDLDLAVALDGPLDFKLRNRLAELVRTLIPEADLDLGYFNRAEPVYRFEALKGRLLFARDPDVYAGHFSQTCREYERQMWDYLRQARYRLQRSGEAA